MRTYKKILLIDDSDTYTWCLQKYLQHRGCPVKTASALKEARTAIQEEMPLMVCCDLDLPDGTAMDLFHTLRRVAGCVGRFECVVGSRAGWKSPVGFSVVEKE